MTSDVKDVLAIVLPSVIPTFAVVMAMLSNNKRIDDLRGEMVRCFQSMEKLFDEKLKHMEDVVDARLKHLEEAIK